MIYLWFTIIYLWFTYGLPMISLWFTNGLPWFHYLWFTYDWSLIYLWFTMIYLWSTYDLPWFTFDFPMIYQWFTMISLPMIYLWLIYDLPIIYHELPMVYLWFTSGLPWFNYLWFTDGLPITDGDFPVCDVEKHRRVHFPMTSPRGGDLVGHRCSRHHHPCWQLYLHPPSRQQGGSWYQPGNVKLKITCVYIYMYIGILPLRLCLFLWFKSSKLERSWTRTLLGGLWNIRNSYEKCITSMKRAPL